LPIDEYPSLAIAPLATLAFRLTMNPRAALHAAAMALAIG
jgi:hypothetical protein